MNARFLAPYDECGAFIITELTGRKYQAVKISTMNKMIYSFAGPKSAMDSVQRAREFEEFKWETLDMVSVRLLIGDPGFLESLYGKEASLVHLALAAVSPEYHEHEPKFGWNGEQWDED